MRKIVLILFLFWTKVAFCQFNDNFSDGNFTVNPVWFGDVNAFSINANSQLQSSLSTLAQTVTLSTGNGYATNAKWNFFVQLNFDPSTTNLVRIYLTSDQQNLKGNLNGYFIQIGESGSTDGFHLYKQSGATVTRIITGAPKSRTNANAITANIQVTRDDNGKWDLYVDNNGGTNYTLEGTVTDNAFVSSAYSGVYCKYTTTRSDGFIFDNFNVTELVPDVTPPTLVKVNAVDSLHLDAIFSEALDLTSAQNNVNYSLNNGFGQPTNIAETALSNVFRLTFANPLPTYNYTLTVNNIKDKKGNVMLGSNTSNFFFIKPYTAKRGDVVINEIFANPSNSPALPQKEFIELWNTTNQYILLNGWKYADQTSTFTFGTDTIKPNQLIILTANADTSAFKPYGKTIGLSPWPSLNNDKDILSLTNEKGDLVDKITYYDNWYKDNAKKAGGYSLEMIDPKNVCTGIQNWTATLDISGGTPAKQNSVYRSQISTIAPKILSVNLIDSVTLQITYSKYVDSLSASNPLNYVINNGVGAAQSATIQSPSFTNITVKLASPLARGINNVLTIGNVVDCAGNLIDNTANTANLFMAKKALKGDILISEVLSNPKINGADFIEIYNNTDHVLDLKELQLANADISGNPASIKNVSTSNLLLQSHQYWVLTSNSANIKASYFVENPNNFTELSSLPTYNNDKGSVILLANNVVVDRFDYNENMHLPLFKDVDGVSLERVSFSKEANASGNFKSAAATVGFATPTYKNSQQEELIPVSNAVTLTSKSFSPDQDGFEDLLEINYRLEGSDNLATVNIYTDRGVLIRRLLKNQTIATQGVLNWDGLNDGAQKCNVGIYVIVFDVFNLNGKTKRYKQTCVLATKLN